MANLEPKQAARRPSEPPEVAASARSALFQSNPVPMWICEPASRRFLAVNDSAVRHYGYSAGQFLAMTTASLESGAGPSANPGLHHHRKADGSIIAVRLETAAIAFESSAAELVTVVDVTAEIEAAHAAQRREQRLQQLFEVATDWYWEIDAQARLTYISPNLETLSGLSVAAMHGKRIQDLTGAEVDPETYKRAFAAMAAHQPFRDMIYRTRPFATDGKTHAVKTSAVPIFDAEGAFTGYCGVSKDVTAQLEAERSLRESEQRFKQLCEAASDYFWEMDAELRITYLSANFEAIFGIPAEDQLGTRMSDAPGFAVEPEMNRRFFAAINARRPYRDLVFFRRLPDGRRALGQGQRRAGLRRDRRVPGISRRRQRHHRAPHRRGGGAARAGPPRGRRRPCAPAFRALRRRRLRPRPQPGFCRSSPRAGRAELRL